jgi:hypothetical protein
MYDEDDLGDGDFDECVICGSDSIMVGGFDQEWGIIDGWGGSNGGYCADCQDDVPEWLAMEPG